MLVEDTNESRASVYENNTMDSLSLFVLDPENDTSSVPRLLNIKVTPREIFQFPHHGLVLEDIFFSSGHAPAFVTFAIAVSLFSSLLIILFKENEILKKINKYVSTHFLHIIVGLVIAGIEQLILTSSKSQDGFREEYVITPDIMQFLLVPLIYQSAKLFYHKYILEQLLEIILFGFFGTFIVVIFVGVINRNLFWAFYGRIDSVWIVSYSASIAFAAAIADVNILSVYFYFVKKDRKRREFYLLLGYHVVTSFIVVEVFKPAASLLHLPAEEHIPIETIVAFFIRCFIRIIGSILVGFTFSGITIFMARFMKGNPQCSYYEPCLSPLSLFFTFLTCREMLLHPELGAFVSCLIQERYMFKNISKATYEAEKSFFRTLSTECELLFFVYVGYKILEDFDYIDLLYALQTFVLSVFIRIVIFFIIATVIKLCTGRRIGFKLVLLIVFGSLKSPRCILIMSEFSYMPYMKLFNHSLLYLIIISTLVGGLASKWIVRVLDEEGESGNTSEEDFQPNGA